MDKASGIYCIMNISNGKLYIGSSVNIKRRKTRHFCKLRNNIHYNNYLQRAYNKSSKYFIFGVIEYCSKDELLVREQMYLDSTKCYNSKNGYNLSNKASNSGTGKYNPASNKAMLIDPNGNVVQTNCLKSLAEEEGIDYSGLFKVLDGQYFQHNGWRKYDPKQVGKKIKLVEKQTIYKIKKNNNIKTGTAIELAKDITELSRRGINCFKTRGWKSYKGWELISINNKSNFTYKRPTKAKRVTGKNNKNCKEVKIKNPQGDVIYIKGINKFCRDNDLDPPGFYRMLSGKINNYKGFETLEN